jgi:hypothetical protein
MTKSIKKAIRSVLQRVKGFIITNILLGLLMLAVLIFFESEFIEKQISGIFAISVEIFVTLFFVSTQVAFVIGTVLIRYIHNKKSLNDLLHEEESDELEFKSSLRFDHKLEKMNKDLEYSVIKTIAAFSNTHGGTLLIGVSDDKKVIGLECDFKTLKRKDVDGFTQHLANLIRNRLGDVIFDHISITIVPYQQKMICRIDVEQQEEPAFITHGNQEEFYIRTVNMSISLPVMQAYSYIERRKNKK